MAGTKNQTNKKIDMEQTKDEQKISVTKVYTVTQFFYEDGSSKMVRRNDGFTVLEIIGIAGMINNDLMSHISGENPLKVDTIKREIIVD